MTDKKKTIKIDDLQYDFDSLTPEAKAQLTNLQLTDAEINQLKIKLGIAQTARAAYAATLKTELAKGGSHRMEN